MKLSVGSYDVRNTLAATYFCYLFCDRSMISWMKQSPQFKRVSSVGVLKKEEEGTKFNKTAATATSCIRSVSSETLCAIRFCSA